MSREIERTRRRWDILLSLLQDISQKLTHPAPDMERELNEIEYKRGGVVLYSFLSDGRLIKIEVEDGWDDNE